MDFSGSPWWCFVALWLCFGGSNLVLVVTNCAEGCGSVDTCALWAVMQSFSPLTLFRSVMAQWMFSVGSTQAMFLTDCLTK